ncbi:hypothetical protein MED297_14760 [Reinekea sp. MED297]|uniref:D-alanine--D-alanine ligase n=2 Tax=Reinekea TaxID=230494 RepID=A4BI66_9GAMM|nr:hypothetical protein MED297_14760 [Reinekea sp. MED297] [Reinekea blandensis MED297]
MPPLTLGRRQSFFEFWPLWLMYLPVAIQWLFLALRYRSLTLPLIANPSLPLSGMVGIPKSTLLRQASGSLQETILPWYVTHKTNEPEATQAIKLMAQLKDKGITLPFVCKPDIGCRGAGVKLIKDKNALIEVLHHYSTGAAIQCQKLSDYEPEAGIFYVRDPDSHQGRIISMAFKYMPYVVGDGRRTLKELLADDPRAGELLHLYQHRHQANWDKVIPENEPYRLVFSASHSKGAIFKDAAECITPELTQALDHLMQQLPDFHYGRLDVKFQNVDELKAGRSLQIVEINTASSESLHIWDSNTSFSEAIRALLLQYRLLFRFGAKTRQRGAKPPGLVSLIKHWQLERTLTRRYPETD